MYICTAYTNDPMDGCVMHIEAKDEAQHIAIAWVTPSMDNGKAYARKATVRNTDTGNTLEVRWLDNKLKYRIIAAQ